MLRRPATTIKLTPEDILEYDDSLIAEQQQLQTQQVSQFSQDQILQEQLNNTTNELIQDVKESNQSQSQVPQPIGQTRDDRIGINRNSSIN